jgi:hypothetical protein
MPSPVILHLYEKRLKYATVFEKWYKNYKCQLIDLNLKLNNQARIARYWRDKTTREYN